MSVLIVGSEGSMGKRYQAILRYLGKHFECIDKHNTKDQFDEKSSNSDGFIIATPTHTHYAFIRELSKRKKPILCEKPITKSASEFVELRKELSSHKTPFRMMLQYEMLTNKDRIGPTLYDYFKHGSDGLIWDCMQIIALARGKIELREQSPVWSCKINGQMLNLSHMDAAYVGYVQKWFNEPAQDVGYLGEIHQKVLESERVKNVQPH